MIQKAAGNARTQALFRDEFGRDFQGIARPANSDVKLVLMSARNLIVRDVQNSLTEDRYIAIGKTREGRFSFLVFTLRVADDQLKLRPISARYMHKKEIAKYEKEIAGL